MINLYWRSPCLNIRPWNRLSHGRLSPLWLGAWSLLWVHIDSRLQGLLLVSEVMTPLPKACEGPSPGLCLFFVAMSIKILNILALPHPGGKQVFIHNLPFHSFLPPILIPIPLPCPYTLLVYCHELSFLMSLFL